MKFQISPAQRTDLVRRLGHHLQPDDHAGGGARYPVVSVYFDNAERDCYWEKARGIPSRRKLRVRVYGSRDGAVAASSFLEIKQKCDGRGVKRRVALPLADALGVCGGAHSATRGLGAADLRVVAEAHALAASRGFRPVLAMRYDRVAYAASDSGSDLRITFDDGLHARFDRFEVVPDDDGFSVPDRIGAEEMVIMEVKVTGCVPYWLGREIAEAGCRMTSHSKYAAALEQRDPVLRAMLSPVWKGRLETHHQTDLSDILPSADLGVIRPECAAPGS